MAKLLVTQLPTPEQRLRMQALYLLIEDCGKRMPPGAGLTGNGHKRIAALLGIDRRPCLFAVVEAVNK
jgi:hypothetical protein